MGGLKVDNFLDIFIALLLTGFSVVWLVIMYKINNNHKKVDSNNTPNYKIGGNEMYRLHVQLTPQIHQGEMQYYWHIDLHDGNNQYTVKSGWAKSLLQCQFAWDYAMTEMDIG